MEASGMLVSSECRFPGLAPRWCSGKSWVEFGNLHFNHGGLSETGCDRTLLLRMFGSGWLGCIFIPLLSEAFDNSSNSKNKVAFWQKAAPKENCLFLGTRVFALNSAQDASSYVN